jgi:hypothetical protein
MYKVGPSRGCGATAVWLGGKTYAANNFVTYQIIENGPHKISVELGYAPYAAAELKIRETRRITLATGSNLNRIEATFNWDGGPEELDVVVGIVKRPGVLKATYSATKPAWMTYWEPEQPGNGQIGCAVILPSQAEPLETADQAFLRTRVRKGVPLAYYAGAGWSKSGDFASSTDWNSYIRAHAETLESK